MTTRLAQLAAIVAVVVALTGVGGATSAQSQFDAASDLLAKGKHAEAAAALLSLADEHPRDPLAADALFTAATLFEDKLGQPVRAAQAYRRLVDAYPDSRTALAASRRLRDLQRSIGSDSAGAKAAAIWSDVLARFPERGAEASVRIVEKLVNDYPTWGGRARALVWLGTLHHRRGEWKPALIRYDESAAAAKDDELRFEALLGASTVLTRLGRFDEARKRIAALPTAGSPGRARAKDDAIERVDRAALRARLYLIAYGVLFAVLLGLMVSLRTATESWGEAARAVAKPPLEVVYMAPVAILFVAVSFTAHFAIAPAVITVCVGGLIIAWLSGAGLRAADRGSRARPLAHAAGSFAAVLALAYIALHRERLLDMLIETVRFGPDV